MYYENLELHKGPRSNYVKILNAEGTIERVMVSDDLAAKWATIEGVEIGRANYTQRTATEKDVEDGHAETVGELINENWSRMEIVNYTSQERLLAKAEFKGKLAQIEKKYSLTTVTDLAETV